MGKQPRSRSRWSQRVKTESTFPPPGLFAEDAETIAETLARPEISPGGLGPAIRMVTFFVNRAGHTLPDARRAELDRAKAALRARKDAAPTLPPQRRRSGRYRHCALGEVSVEKHGRTWLMRRESDQPPIALGPDGWRYLRPLA